MDIERIVVRLVADTTSYIEGLNRAQARLLYFAGFVMEQVGRSAIELAANFERLAIAFEVMTGSAETGLKILNDITRLAIESPFTSMELIQAGKQVKAFGFDTSDIIPILSRLGDVSVATGTDINRIILAFGQVRTTGRLMGQELRQFTNAGVPILEYLSKVMGVATSAVPQLVRQGRVGFPEVARAFNMMTSEGGLFFGMMERTNLETVWGRWQNVVESLQVSIRNLGLEFFQLFRVKETLTTITDALKDMNSEAGLEGMRQKLREIKAYADFIVQPFIELVNSVRAFAEANPELTRWLVIVAAVVVAVKALAVAFTVIVGTVTALVSLTMAILAPTITIGVVILKLAAVLAIILVVVTALVVAWKLVAFFVDQVWETILNIGESDAWKLFKEMAVGAWETIAQWGEAAWDRIGEAMEDLLLGMAPADSVRGVGVYIHVLRPVRGSGPGGVRRPLEVLPGHRRVGLEVRHRYVRPGGRAGEGVRRDTGRRVHLGQGRHPRRRPHPRVEHRVRDPQGRMGAADRLAQDRMEVVQRHDGPVAQQNLGHVRRPDRVLPQDRRREPGGRWPRPGDGGRA
jgi:tape measure domain-containing protein